MAKNKYLLVKAMAGTVSRTIVFFKHVDLFLGTAGNAVWTRSGVSDGLSLRKEKFILVKMSRIEIALVTSPFNEICC